jgi:hypothetical protein
MCIHRTLSVDALILLNFLNVKFDYLVNINLQQSCKKKYIYNTELNTLYDMIYM